MAKLITPTERIAKARKLIQSAREIPVPDKAGWDSFSYTAQVKDTLRKAFELVKLIHYSPSTPPEVKADSKKVIDEIACAETEILKGKKAG